MARYRKKPVEVEAVQWLKVGDHPAVKRVTKWHTAYCRKCEKHHNEHGKIKTLESAEAEFYLVCPGDFIITGDAPGDIYPCKPDIFAATHEKVGK